MAKERKPLYKRWTTWVIGWFGALFLMIVVIALVNPSNESTPKPEHSAVGAWVKCQLSIEDRLKSPGSAKYPPNFNDYVVDLGNGQYLVTAYVDSQNGFGALIRTNFDCTVQHTQGDTYHLVSLDFPE